MIDLLKLRTEIDNDPLNRGYAGMTNQQLADDINTLYRTRNKTSMSGDEIFQQTHATEFTSLTSEKKSLWISFTSKDSIDPFASNNVAFVQWIFGSGSTTISNLANARRASISRATELGLPSITDVDVRFARGL